MKFEDRFSVEDAMRQAKESPDNPMTQGLLGEVLYNNRWHKEAN